MPSPLYTVSVKSAVAFVPRTINGGAVVFIAGVIGSPGLLTGRAGGMGPAWRRVFLRGPFWLALFLPGLSLPFFWLAFWRSWP